MESLLLLASRVRAPIEISARHDGDEIRFKSYFLPIKESPLSTPLRVYRPTSDLAETLLVPGAKVRVTFSLNAKIYSFLSSIRGFLARSQEIFQIETPSQVLHSQRGNRAFYRLRMESNVQILFWTFPSSDPSAPQAVEIRRNGTLLDVSAGGISIKMDAETARLLKMGIEVGLCWSFLPQEPAYVMKGIVRNREILPNPHFTKVGIQFIESTNRMEYQANVNRLTRFITEQERIRIQREKRY